MRTSILMSSLFVVALTGCGSSHHESTAASSPPPTGAMGGGGDRCPMHVTGTQVAAADTDNGVAITFSTTGDLAELRARVRDMASMHEHMTASGGHDMGMMKGEHEHMAMPPSHATAADVDGGERVTLTPEDPAQLDALRAAARHHVEMMQGGDCPMMMKPMGEAPAAPADEHAAHH